MTISTAGSSHYVPAFEFELWYLNSNYTALSTRLKRITGNMIVLMYSEHRF